jgi:FeS assembly protein IscX
MASKELTWKDAERVGIALCKKHPDLDPSNMTLGDVHRYATELHELKGDPAEFDQANLEAIRRAWNTELLDRTQ